MRRAYAIHRPVENVYLVRERDRRRLRELLSFTLAILTLGGGLLAYTWVHLEILRTGYRIDDLEKELHELLEEERRGGLEASSMTHPRRIGERARHELGMRQPTPDETFFYEEMVR